MSTGPLAQSRIVLTRMSLQARLLAWAPLPILLLAIWVVRFFDPHWYTNVILTTILALFAVGQFVAIRQFLNLSRGTRSMLRTLGVLESLGTHKTIESFRTALEGLPSGHIRDLVVSWLCLGSGRGNDGRGLQLHENARERRDVLDSKLLGIHVSLNRNILKLGFLGTLVGLLLTFPPMRAAVMGLSASGGEMKFIKDIAAAIDEDAYAIQATLVSLGLSFFLEAMVVQLLERLLVSYQVVDSHLADWYILELRPWLESMAPSSVTESVGGGSQENAAASQRAFVAAERARMEQALLEAKREHERREEELQGFEARYRDQIPVREESRKGPR